MSTSAADAARARRGVTLVELVIVMVVSGILFVTTPILVFHGVKTLVFLPKALAANDVATEVLHQIIEGGFSTLQSTPVRGLRFAVRRSSAEPAVWLSEPNRIGFVTSDNQYVLLWLDDETVITPAPEVDVIRRAVVSPSTCASVPSATGEIVPYHASGSVQIIPTGSLFLYYDSGGTPVAPLPSGCPPATTIRRVGIAFTAQTGNGNFDEGDAREEIASSVAIRVP